MIASIRRWLADRRASREYRRRFREEQELVALENSDNFEIAAGAKRRRHLLEEVAALEKERGYLEKDLQLMQSDLAALLAINQRNREIIAWESANFSHRPTSGKAGSDRERSAMQQFAVAADGRTWEKRMADAEAAADFEDERQAARDAELAELLKPRNYR